jgi:hypothetical protein
MQQVCIGEIMHVIDWLHFLKLDNEANCTTLVYQIVNSFYLTQAHCIYGMYILYNMRLQIHMYICWCQKRAGKKMHVIYMYNERGLCI